MAAGTHERTAPEVPERYHGIGIRIEDDVAVSAQGCEVITDAAPKSVADIEAIKRAAS